jgi:plastocyanin
MPKLLSLVCAMLALVACSAPPASPTPQPSPTQVVPTSVPTVRAAGDVRASATASAQAAGTAGPEVDILDDLYLPAQITIRAGETITFRNYGGKVHDVVSRNNDWPSPFIQPGDRTRIAFPTPGRFEYTCSIHATMGGVVIVE